MIHPLGIAKLVASILIFQLILSIRQDNYIIGTIALIIGTFFLLLFNGSGVNGHGGRFNVLEVPEVGEAQILVELFMGMEQPRVIALPREKRAGTDVHDHAVQTSIVRAIRLLQERYGTTALTTSERTRALEDIKKYIFNGYDGDYKKKEGAYSTLRYMERNKGICTEVKLSDLDILLLVWARIGDPVNSEITGELKSNLVESLSEASVSIDNPYCLTGRVTRMVQALESLDKEQIVNIKSTDTVRDEITHKIPQLRDLFFKEHPALLDIYNQDKDDEPTKQVLNRLKGHINDTLNQEYVAAGLLTKPEFNRTVAPLVEAL